MYRGPYQGVDWSLDLRLKAQHHGHVGSSQARVRAYDAAGYHVLALVDYSGAPTLSYALRYRIWPASAYLPATFTSTLGSIRLFVPSAEEVGDPAIHVTSPFLTRYVQRWDPAQGSRRPDEYENVSELRRLIVEHGGFPLLAHPWHESLDAKWLSEFKGMEIYSAFAEAFYRQGTDPFFSRDRNRVMLGSWDRALAINPSLIGTAVNDHFGPETFASAVVRDSGKIVVLAKDYTLDAYRDAFARGAILAVRDLGAVKDRYPRLRAIRRNELGIEIDAEGSVSWISMGRHIESGAMLRFERLPADATYVRAEIANAEGSVVYTQAFTVRARGDIDGDGDIDRDDRAVCADVRAGGERDANRIAACLAMG